MPSDGLFLHFLVNELKDNIEGGKINKIIEPSNLDIVLQIRNHATNYQLFISGSLDLPRIYLSNDKHTSIDIPKNFCVILRKYIERGIITSINQIENDRVIVFNILANDELGDTRKYKLIFELMGRNSNLILINSDDIVIDAMRKVPPTEDTNRIILPKSCYSYPVSNNQINPFNLDDNIINLSSLQGISKQTQVAIEISKLSVKDYINLPCIPTIYQTEKRLDFYVLPLFQYNIVKNDFNSISSMLEYYYKNYKAVSTDKAKELKKVVRNKLTHLLTKLDKLNTDLENAHDNLKYADFGILLQANLYQIKKGASKVTLNNFLNNNEEITIELDPLLDPSRNLKRIFTKAKKAKNAINQVNIQIEITSKEIKYLDTIINQIDFASSTDLNEIRDELVLNKYLKPVKQNQPKNKKINITKYMLDSVEVLVGKNNIQNDYITHKLSRSYDWWFHAKDAPGSHVLFKSPSPDYVLSEKEIRYCANLASCFSKYSKSSSVAVDYLQVKYIKKIPGVKGCEVTYTNQKTIYIDPDTNLL